jgi:hypothetical protein
MVEIRTVGVFALAKFQAVLSAHLGLLAGLLYSFGGLIIDLLVSSGRITSTSTPGVGGGTALAFLAIVGMPLLFGACGFVVGIIEAALYNVLVRWWGGMRIEL